jgi:hypothetical protein
MATTNQRLRPHAQVVDTELGDAQIALLHLRTLTYYSLNLTAAHIWRGLKQGRSLNEISAGLRAEFEVDEKRAEVAVLDLVQALLDQDLVEAAQ